jgi:hypothetical protein
MTASIDSSISFSVHIPACEVYSVYKTRSNKHARGNGIRVAGRALVSVLDCSSSKRGNCFAGGGGWVCGARHLVEGLVESLVGAFI